MQREFFGVADVAALLGVQPVTIYRWCRSGRLPSVKIGKQWRIHRSVLEGLIPRAAPPRLSDQCDEGQSMQDVSPATRSLAARILRIEAGGKPDSVSLTAAGERAISRLRPRLTELLGQHGFAALLRRAKYLAQGQFSLLADLRIDALGEASTIAASADPDQTAVALNELLTRLLWLLETFLGQALTVHLLGEIWPELKQKEAESGEHA